MTYLARVGVVEVSAVSQRARGVLPSYRGCWKR